jgi:hypothetical protein
MSKHGAPPEDNFSPAAVNKRYRYAPPDESITTKALNEHKAATAKETSGIPKFETVKHILTSEDGVGDFLMRRDIVKVYQECPRCQKKVPAPDKKRVQRCHSRPCVEKHKGEWCQSVYKSSFFEDSRGGRAVVMLFLYHWLIGANYKQLGIITGWSRQKVFSYLRFAQDLVATVATTHPNDNTPAPQIGGDGIIVEIDDESNPFEKRKLHKLEFPGEGAWLFGGVENTLKRRYFCVVVEDRAPETLISVIHKFVAPGSIIRSDCWSANDIIEVQEDAEYICGTESHHAPLLMMDPLLGAIPSWYSLKRSAESRKRGKKQQPSFLFEYIWRRSNETKLWNGLVNALQSVNYESGPASNPSNRVKKFDFVGDEQQQHDDGMGLHQHHNDHSTIPEMMDGHTAHDI